MTEPTNDQTRFRFNKEKLLAIPAPEPGTRAVYHDTQLPGLQIRVTSTGGKTFSLYRRTKGAGAPERITLGRFPSMSVEQARKAAALLNAEIEQGSNPAEAKRAGKAEMTLDEYFALYGQRHGSKKVSWRDDQQRYRDYLAPTLGARRLSGITRALIAKALADAERAGKAPATVRQVRALASGIFARAVEWGLLDANPAAGIRVSGHVVSRDRFLQPGELPAFFQALADEPSDGMRDFILLALLTGARRANLCAMHWREIDLAAGNWRLPTTKNGTPQTVTLCPEAVAILRGRHETTAGGFVFPSRSATGHFNGARDGIARVLARAGIPYGRKTDGGVTLHDLRRTLGSWQARTGASLAIIGKSLNHKSPQATAIYARLDLDPVRASVNTAVSAMLEAGGLKAPAEVLPIKRPA
ncbi:MAG: tyrosine-type recombinase/integrase [Candidatus Accumulibacter similis]|nr:MAG: tyrosine-type recombinase/integrase [Candidatus Accumulibacter similis]